MKKWLKSLAKSRYPYEPLITIEISRDRLLNNLSEFAKIAINHRIAPVLKSNAYGHGLVEVAEVLENSLVPFFVVDSYFEVVALRTRGIKTPLLVIGYSRPDTVAGSRLKKVSFTIGSMGTLRAIVDHEEIRSPLHLKIDTGMRRQGILPEDVDEAIRLLKKHSRVAVEGICSHLSDADNADTSFTDKQIIVWNDIAEKFKTAFSELKYIHLSNTDGHRFADRVTANVTRLGLGLYGLADGDSFPSKPDLLPVLSMKTIITGVKTLKKGETVGYGNTFKALSEMLVATIPLGYCEGVDRRLSNRGTVLVGENRIPCPIIGRVSMNITTIDVTKIQSVNEGMEVTVISNNTNDPNSIVSIAKKCDTIPYEIAVKISAHLKRVVVD